MYCFRGKLNCIEKLNVTQVKKLRRLHFIGAIENRFIAKLYVFDQKEDEDSIESFIALLKNFRSLFFSFAFAPQFSLSTSKKVVSKPLRN